VTTRRFLVTLAVLVGVWIAGVVLIWRLVGPLPALLAIAAWVAVAGLALYQGRFTPGPPG
jgi:hypothetical protein